jgi:hypothetical protein
MRIFAILSLVALAGCAHVASTNATFVRRAEAPPAPLVLKLARHMDTIVRGPDIEEDQLLVLEVRDFQIGRKLDIPSAAVRPRFSVTRFGPGSQGEVYKGYLIVRSVTPQKVVAHVHLDVRARTADNSYIQNARFHKDYVFYPADEHD